MRGKGFSWRFGVPLLGTLAAPVLVSLSGDAFAEDPPPAALPAVAPAAPAVQVLDLRQCREMALHQQPAIAAAHASLNAAVEKQAALDKLRFAAIVQRDLPIRRKQAALGVEAAQATLIQVEWDTIYGVTFSYLSVLYANEQLQVADEAIKRLTVLRNGVAEGVTAGERTDLSKVNLSQIDAYLESAQGRRQEAVLGLERAASALREAMGVGPDCRLMLAQSVLPGCDAAPDKEQIVALALARRGEMSQAAAAHQATGFEIEAQKSTFFFSGKTFAIGSDIHAYPIPAADHGDNYKPGAIGIEMPALLVGTRCDRVQQAEAYHERAGAVVEKTRNLVALDAEQTYLKWLEAGQKLEHFRASSKAASEFAVDQEKKFQPKVANAGSLDNALNAAVLAVNQKLHVNQAHYQLLLGLAGLERVTAGGFCSGLEAPH